MSNVIDSKTKNLARNIYKKYREELGLFEQNKEIIDKYYIMSKKRRNKVAGYITRLINKEKYEDVREIDEILG